MMTRQQASNSLIRGLNVINQALAAHRDQRPWKQIIEASHEEVSKQPLVIVIEDDCSESATKETFLVQVTDERFCLVSTQAANAEEAMRPASTRKPDWKVTAGYLDDLACRTAYYIEHPSRIGLDWLTRRLGLTTPS
ncbi:MAG: hypothetical protein ACI8P0_002009 [Planctomycetaceae bacterium]|jgi:hypothetical protein